MMQRIHVPGIYYAHHRICVIIILFRPRAVVRVDHHPVVARVVQILRTKDGRLHTRDWEYVVLFGVLHRQLFDMSPVWHSWLVPDMHMYTGIQVANQVSNIDIIQVSNIYLKHIPTCL